MRCRALAVPRLLTRQPRRVATRGGNLVYFNSGNRRVRGRGDSYDNPMPVRATV